MEQSKSIDKFAEIFSSIDSKHTLSSTEHINIQQSLNKNSTTTQSVKQNPPLKSYGIERINIGTPNFSQSNHQSPIPNKTKQNSSSNLPDLNRKRSSVVQSPVKVEDLPLDQSSSDMKSMYSGKQLLPQVKEGAYHETLTNPMYKRDEGSQSRLYTSAINENANYQSQASQSKGNRVRFNDQVDYQDMDEDYSQS